MIGKLTAIMLGALACTMNVLPASAARSVEQVVHSDALPSIDIRVSEEFRFFGKLRFDVGEMAEAEQYIFGVRDGARLERVLVIHFEHFLPSSSRTFGYPRLRMATLGNHEYLNQTWALSQYELMKSPEMVELLRNNALEAGDSWVVDRYVRALDENPKYEMIFFYLEAGSTLPTQVEYGIGTDDQLPPSPPPDIESAIHERARKAFRIEPSRAIE